MAPSHEDLKVVGTFNPGAVARRDAAGNQVTILVRVAEQPAQRHPGFTALPRYSPSGDLVVDHVPDDQLTLLDPRVVESKANGQKRLTFVSHLRVFISNDEQSINAKEESSFLPKTEYETYGVEDPRITRIGDRSYITYVAVSPHGAATALASTIDFVTFERHGIIFCPENKDVLLLPEKVNGRHVAIHRPNPATHFAPQEMWVATSDDLLHWGCHKPLFAGTSEWETGRIGGGCPPIRTEHGWLEIYHGNNKSPGDDGIGAYFGAALLLDLDDPSKVIGRSDSPILSPETEYETQGFVPNVVFPTGIVERNETLLIYYGAADTKTCVVGFDRQALLAQIKPL